MAKGGFPGGMGGMGGGNMQQLMMKAQKMQQDVARAQAELNEREFVASSGGGMVTVQGDGVGAGFAKGAAAEFGDGDDVEMLQDLVLSAVNEALRTATKTVEDEIGKITGGLGLGF